MGRRGSFAIPAPFSRRRTPWLTLAALVLLAAATVASTVFARSSVRDQERAALEAKGQETKALLDVAISGIEQQLLVMSGALRAAVSEVDTFHEVGRSLVGETTEEGNPPYDALALVDTSGDEPVVLAVLGEGLAVGRPLATAAAAAVDRAGPKVVSTGVFRSGDERRWGSALGGDALPTGRTIYGESAVTPPAEPASPDAPLADVKIVLYGGQRAARDEILGANTKEWPLDDPLQVDFQYGADTWRMEVAPRGSLVGTTTARLPWFVGGLGVLVTLAITALLEVIQRRRDYALMLVDERTAELTRSIAELERARTELEDADRLKDEFLDIAAHELRTPLTAIAGFSEILSNGGQTDPEMRSRLLSRIHANAHVMEELTNQLLDLSRLRAGRVELDLAPVTLREAVGEALERVGGAVDNRVVTLDITEDCVAVADDQALDRILVNLITNATKFSEPATPITISARTEGDHVRVSVADQGIGIAADQQERIFERFYRAGDTGGGTRGTGVGLAIVAKYVELHGGRVGVESEPGVGSTVWFTLPLAREDARPG